MAGQPVLAAQLFRRRRQLGGDGPLHQQLCRGALLQLERLDLWLPRDGGEDEDDDDDDDDDDNDDNDNDDNDDDNFDEEKRVEEGQRGGGEGERGLG